MNIAMITGSRAEWGLLKPLADILKPSIYATGSHLSPAHGFTLGDIFDDGFTPMSIPCVQAWDHSTSVSDAMALVLAKLSLIPVSYDAVILLGDRYEIFAAATAVFNAGVPIIHIHGGETTRGSKDDVYRDCITRMATYHFVAAEPYRERVIQIGADPDKVWTVGALGCDGLEPNHDREDYILCVWHPTLGEDELFGELLQWLGRRDEPKVFIRANADPNYININTSIDRFQEMHEGTIVYDSLPRAEYLNLLRYCKCAIGNSSSFVIEAPALGTVVYLVGRRQDGRLMGDTITSVDRPSSISEANHFYGNIGVAFRVNRERYLPYGGGNVAQAIGDKINDLFG